MNAYLSQHDELKLSDEQVDEMLREATGGDFERLRVLLCADYAKLTIDSGRYPTTTESFWSALFHFALKTHATTCAANSASASLFVSEYRNARKMYDTVMQQHATPALLAPKSVVQHARTRDVEQCVHQMVQRAMAHAIKSATSDSISKTVRGAYLQADEGIKDYFADGVALQRSNEHRAWKERRRALREEHQRDGL
jgi:hypothetical protein